MIMKLLKMHIRKILNNYKKKKVLIFGGAGFIGSWLADFFLDNNWGVTVVDGLVDGTGGSIDNIVNIASEIHFIQEKLENINNFDKLISNQDIIIDSMGWTSHIGAIEFPERDVKLNLLSHIFLLEKIKKYADKSCSVIYLGSIGQYGTNENKIINESSCFMPLDIQGVNKVAAESFFRVYSNIYKINTISLRLPNCFGERQPFKYKDIGLVGGFIRDALLNKKIEVFGSNRKRNILYVKDLANIVYRLSSIQFQGFTALNVYSNNLTIEDLASKIVQNIKGSIVIQSPLPKSIKNIDVSNSMFDTTKIESLLGDKNLTKIDTSIINTISYFKQRAL
jgi:UDP-glucose 4-epimerase